MSSIKSELGFVPILVLLLVAIIVISSAVLTKNIPFNQSQPTADKGFQGSSSAGIKSSPTPTATPSKPATKSATSPTKTNPTTTVTPTPTATSTISITKKNTCAINVINGKLNGDTSNPLLVTLTYSFTGFGNVYMTGAQWDFDNNGSWDTDISQSNGTIEKTYDSGGSYNVGLRVKGSDGNTTDICSKSFSLANVIDIILKGQVYKDNNCNKSKEDGDTGISGVKMTIDSNGQVLSDVTTDSSGNYSFTKKISPEVSLSLTLGPADHNYVFYTITNTFSKNNPIVTLDVPLCYQ